MMKSPRMPDAGKTAACLVSRWWPALLIGCLTITGGCTYAPHFRSAMSPIESMKCRACTDFKARFKANQIWRSKYAHCYCDRDSARDIRQGFVDGFVDKTRGGTGCPPLMPPENYCRLRSLTGRKPSASCWFQGYPLGVAAAESSGACDWCKTPMSPQIAACLIQPRCMPGCKMCEPECACGMIGCQGDCGSVSGINQEFYGEVFDHDEVIQQPEAFQQPFVEQNLLPPQHLGSPFDSHPAPEVLAPGTELPSAELLPSVDELPDAEPAPAPSPSDAEFELEAPPVPEVSPNDVSRTSSTGFLGKQVWIGNVFDSELFPPVTVANFQAPRDDDETPSTSASEVNSDGNKNQVLPGDTQEAAGPVAEQTN